MLRVSAAILKLVTKAHRAHSYKSKERESYKRQRKRELQKIKRERKKLQKIKREKSYKRQRKRELQNHATISAV